MPKQPIYDLDLNSITELMTSWGEPAYRTKQIWQGLYQHFYSSPAQFPNIPKPLARSWRTNWISPSSSLCAILNSSDKQTRKTLFKLHDGHFIEAVLMRYGEPSPPCPPLSPILRRWGEREEGRQRRTLCISTQAGCAMGCVFCATGQMGFKRHLSSGEIVAQVMYYRAPVARGRISGHQHCVDGHGRTLP